MAKQKNPVKTGNKWAGLKGVKGKKARKKFKQKMRHFNKYERFSRANQQPSNSSSPVVTRKPTIHSPKIPGPPRYCDACGKRKTRLTVKTASGIKRYCNQDRHLAA